jgi:hypothetical protein
VNGSRAGIRKREEPGEMERKERRSVITTDVVLVSVRVESAGS